MDTVCGIHRCAGTQQSGGPACISSTDIPCLNRALKLNIITPAYSHYFNALLQGKSLRHGIANKSACSGNKN